MTILRSIGRHCLSRSVPTTRQLATAAAGPLRRTALYDTHVKAGGSMVEFGGFQMPVQYKSQSISESVLWTRSKASLFDVYPYNHG
jgi:aminomethyltransferase